MRARPFRWGCGSRSAGEGLEVGVGGGDGGETELLDEDVEDRRGDEGGEGGPDADVLDAEGEERQQDADGLLLVPGEHQRERQVVDAAIEDLGEGDGDLDGGVGVVALAHVEQARDPADVAEVRTLLTTYQPEAYAINIETQILRTLRS